MERYAETCFVFQQHWIIWFRTHMATKWDQIGQEFDFLGVFDGADYGYSSIYSKFWITIHMKLIVYYIPDYWMLLTLYKEQ